MSGTDDPVDLYRDMLRFSEQLAEGARRIPELPTSPAPGATPREAVFSLDGMTLYRYSSSRREEGQPPLLVVYALVNRPHMLDLESGRSFIGGLLEAGRDVYLVDWGSPGEHDADRGLDDYLTRYLGACVDHLTREHQMPAVDLLGVCQGGTFALCHAAMNPAHVRRLVLMVTPVDFHVPDFLLCRWMKYVDVDRLVETFGNVPGHLLNRAFLALKPMSLSGGKARDVMQLMQRPDELATFARMEQWLHDSPDQAGRAFREFVAAFIRDNALVAGGLEVAGKPVVLETLECPVLNVYATRDHIVPPDSSRALATLVGSAPYREIAHDSGHIGIFAGRDALGSVPVAVARWLSDAEPA